jgi:Glycosyl hydrolase family 26
MLAINRLLSELNSKLKEKNNYRIIKYHYGDKKEDSFGIITCCMKENWVLRVLAWLLTAPLVPGVFAQGDLPSDKTAIRETVNLYRNLKKMLGKGILFGHQDDLGYEVGWKDEEGRSDIKDVTGDYPAVYGWEPGRLEIDNSVNVDSVPKK